MASIGAILGMTQASQVTRAQVSALAISIGHMKLGKPEHVTEVVQGLEQAIKHFGGMKKATYTAAILDTLERTIDIVQANWAQSHNGTGEHAGHGAPTHVAAAGKGEQSGAHRQSQ